MAHLKTNIVEVKPTDECMGHALTIAIARDQKYSNYDSCRTGWKIRLIVRQILETTGIDLTSGGGIPEIARFQEHFRKYKIVVYQSLRCDNNVRRSAQDRQTSEPTLRQC